MAHILITKRDHIEEFQEVLQKANHNVIGLNFLDYRPVPFENVPQADCIFFYSRRGVEHFFQQMKNKNLELPEGIQFAALGENTAESLEDYVKEVHFIGEGQPGTSFNAFKKWFRGDTVIAVKADNSMNRLRQVTGVNWKIIDLVVYSNEIKESINFGNHDLAVLTSPLNAKAYLKFQPENLPTIVAIGQTTASAIQSMTDEKCYVAPKPYMKDLSYFVLELLEKSD